MTRGWHGFVSAEVNLGNESRKVCKDTKVASGTLSAYVPCLSSESDSGAKHDARARTQRERERENSCMHARTHAAFAYVVVLLNVPSF